MASPVTQAQVDYWLAQREANRAIAAQARSCLAAIVALLVDEFSASRIILFGSLAKGNFAPESDIDLAVEGLARESYFAALAAVNRLSPWWVDLKPLEDLEPRFRERVLTTGECIYARENQQ